MAAAEDADAFRSEYNLLLVCFHAQKIRKPAHWVKQFIFLAYIALQC
jgi:hypothetical protein